MAAVLHLPGRSFELGAGQMSAQVQEALEQAIALGTVCKISTDAGDLRVNGKTLQWFALGPQPDREPVLDQFLGR
jgi:peptidyl-tRNA hydrolase